MLWIVCVAIFSVAASSAATDEEHINSLVVSKVVPFQRAYSRRYIHHLYYINSRRLPTSYYYEGSEGNVLPYSEYLENKVIIDYFCPELKVMHVSYKGNKQHISATPIKNGEMMMVSTKEGYCGANKAMYYVKSLPHIDDVFYTSKRDKFELTKRSNTFYKGTEGGVAFYVW